MEITAASQFDKKTEILAGATTFLATMYIIVVNPAILSKSGMSYNAVLTATVLTSALSSIFMGLYARNPIVVAPGMGINAFFTYSVVLGLKIPWEIALGAVFWSGIIFLVLSLLNVRSLIVKAIPSQIRYGIATGIGLFITLIGLINAGFTVSSPTTVLTRGNLSPGLIVFILGLFLTSILIVKKVKGALIVGIIFTTLAAIPVGRVFGSQILMTPPSGKIFAWPDFSLFFQLDLIGSLKLSVIPVIFTFFFTDMFDSISTFVGVAEAGNLIDKNGDPRNIRESMIVDSVSTIFSGLSGTSPGTSYIESAAGIREGGRGGLTAITAGILFLPFIFFSPILSIIPPMATAPALVLVGVFMMKPVEKIHWLSYEDSIPAFLAMVLIPYTYSITEGIIWSFLSWTFLKLLNGKKAEIPITLLILDLFIILAIILGK